jgi:predicted phosphodiesterase
MEKKEIINLMLGKLNRENSDSWEDISKATGLNFAPDHLRKMSYGVKLYDEYLEEEGRKNRQGKDAQDIEEKLLDLKKTRKQIQDERTLVNKKIRALARVEDFINIMRDELELLAYEKPLEVTKVADNKESENTGVLLLSDIHYGLGIDSPINTYDPDIAKERMNYVVNEVTKYCNLHKINHLYIYELGDTISGHIHNNLRLENRINVTNQVIGASEMISTTLFELAKKINKITFTMVEGNHDRLLPKKDDNLNEDSFSALVQELIIQRTKNISNLTIIPAIGKTFSLIDIKGFTCVGVHGDKDKPQGVIEGLTALTGKVPDYVFMGHFHNANEFTVNQSEVLVNGSFSGTDEYAYNIRKNSKLIQKFLVFNEDGRLCTYNINLKNKAN